MKRKGNERLVKETNTLEPSKVQSLQRSTKKYALNVCLVYSLYHQKTKTVLYHTHIRILLTHQHAAFLK